MDSSSDAVANNSVRDEMNVTFKSEDSQVKGEADSAEEAPARVASSEATPLRRPSPLPPTIQHQHVKTPSSPSRIASPKLESDILASSSSSSTPRSSMQSPIDSQAGPSKSASPGSPNKKRPTNGHASSAEPSTPYQLTPVTTSLPSTARRKKKTDNADSDHPPQIIDHLPKAEDEALQSFTRIEDNWYANKSIGRSKGHDWGLVCECNYREGRDDLSRACTDEGECINRLTQVECLAEDCRCGHFCQNQRFQRKEYAKVDIVKTEKKGYGLRATQAIPAESFVYEYIGEVVPEVDFRKRMQRYHDERIPHFYFMMLQRDEYLDATKKGDIARFINHSCNPNCYVAKWSVGKHMRMGIFTQRDIIKGEELTFNYNVDRYGNEAQPCYCGEPNCVGQLGGKTQTDIGGMSNLYIEALGIVDEVERLQARGSRKQKSRVLDEDFTPTLHPLGEDVVPLVATAIRQAASNKSILTKLLTRIDMTEDVAVQKRFVRLHGFVLMAGVLNEWKDDKEVLLLSMRILAKWPLIARNKVVDTGVEAIVEGLRESEDGDVSSLASELYDAWQQLSLEFRIARKEGGEDGGDLENGPAEDDDALQHSRRRRRDDDLEDTVIQERMDYALDHAQAPNDVSASLGKVVPRPLGKTAASTSLSSSDRFGRGPHRSSSGRARLSGANRSVLGGVTPGTPKTPDEQGGKVGSPSASASRAAPPQPALSIEEIIKRANEAQEAERKRQEEEAAAAALKAEKKKAAAAAAAAASSSSSKGKSRDRSSEKHRSSSSSSSRKRKSQLGEEPGSEDKKARVSSSSGSNGTATNHTDKSGSHSSSSDPQRSLDKKLHLLVSEVVVKVMSPHRDSCSTLSSKESFKRHARELTDLVCKKERKNPKFWPPKDGKLDKLSSDKKDKIRTFAEGYTKKLVEKRKNAAATTPASGGGGLSEDSSQTNGDAQQMVAGPQ